MSGWGVPSAGRGRLWVSAIAVSFVVAVGVVMAHSYLITGGTLDVTSSRPIPGHFSNFSSVQAKSLLNGRLDVPFSVLGNECFVYNNRCYGYFGLTPSIMRLPATVFAPSIAEWDALYLQISLFTAVLSALGVGLAFLRRIALYNQAISSTALFLAFLLYALSVGFSPLLIVLTRIAVYEETIAWSVAFSMITLLLVFWYYTRPRAYLLVIAVVSASLSACARPSGAIVALGLGLFLIGVSWWRGTEASDTAPHPVLALALKTLLAIVPGVLCASVFFAKFSTPLPSFMLNTGIRYSEYWIAIRLANGNATSGLQFVPTQLWNFVRPDNPLLLPSGEFVQLPTQLILMRNGSMHLESAASLTSLQAVSIFAFISCLACFATRWLGLRLGVPRVNGRFLTSRSEREIAPVVLLLPVILLGPAAISLTFVGVAVRYLGDFYPFVAACSLSFFLIVPALWRRGVLSSAFALAFLGGLLVYGVALGYFTRTLGLHV